MTKQRGFSIIELMVGLTIGLLMLTVLSALLVNNNQARAELDRSMQQVENGRYAMQMLSGELRLAGFYGAGMSVGAAPLVVPDPCATDVASLKAALPVTVQGYSQITASPLTCIDIANMRTGSDVLVVRRAQTEPVAVAALEPTLPYIQTINGNVVLDAGSNSGNFTLTKAGGALAPIHPYMVHIYFISPCSTPSATCSAASDNGNPIPTLNRLEFDGTVWRAVPLVEGIERLRVEYGVDSLPALNKDGSTGDGSPDSYVISPTTAADWGNVVSVNIGLLARNTRATPGYTDTKTYRLATLDVAAPSDAFKRHAYNGVMRLMNVSIRRKGKESS